MFTYDGRNFKAVDFGAAVNDSWYTSSLSEALWLRNQSVVSGLTPVNAYALVPWLYRAVCWRANQVSRFPFSLMSGEDDVTDQPAYESLLKSFRKRLWMLEAQLCLTGAAYELLEANERGRNITPRTLLSLFVTPRYDSRGLTFFQFSNVNQADILATIPLDRMLWWWRPNFTSEVMPGPCEAQTALGAASMLYALDSFSAAFFNRGGVPVTIAEVPPNMQPADKEEFQNWINRAVMGVRNAFKILAVRGGIKATVIGSKVRDSEAPELTALQRDNVAVAMGVPPSVIDGRSSDDSNSRSEKVAAITDTVIPEIGIIFERYNDQLFSQFDLELVAHPEKLDIMQTVQLEQAQTLKDLTGGKPIMTTDEARDWLNMEPMEEKEKIEPPPPVTPFPVQGQPVPPEQITKALAEWRRAAIDNIRAGGVFVLPSVPNIIPDSLALPINAALENCKAAADVRSAFERHWPQVQPDDGLSELRAARITLDRFNELAGAK